MTDAPVSNVLEEIAAEESRKLQHARLRYWRTIAKLADGEGKLDAKQRKELAADVREFVAHGMIDGARSHVEALTELREYAGGGASAPDARRYLAECIECAQQTAATVLDLKRRLAENECAKVAAKQAHEMSRELARCEAATLAALGDDVPDDLTDTAQRRNDVHAAGVELERELVLATREAESSRWNARRALRSLDEAVRGRRRMAEQAAARLVSDGCPEEALPDLTVEAEPPARIPHRVLAKTFDGVQIREVGDVVYLTAPVTNHAVRPLADGETEDSVPPRWRIQVTRNHRDVDGKLRMTGDVYETTVDPMGNPCVRFVGDDVPLGVGAGEPQEQNEEQDDEQGEEQQRADV